MGTDKLIAAIISSVVLIMSFILVSLASSPLEEAVIEISKGTSMAWMLPIIFLLISFVGILVLFSKIAKKF